MNSLKKNNLNFNYKMKWANLTGALIILALLLAPTTQGFSQEGSPDAPAANSPYFPWSTQPVDSPPFFYMMTDRSLRFDRSVNHVPCTAYGGDHLYYSCYNPATQTWSQEIVDLNPMVGSYAALDFNNFNIPFISYYDALNATLKMAYKTAIGWQINTVDTGANGPPTPTPVEGLEPSELEVSTPEQQQEAEQTYWEQLLEFFPYLRLYAPGFLFGKVGVGKHTSIDIDANNTVHISYYDQLHGALKYAFWDGTTILPLTEFVDWGHQSDMGLWTSIAVDDWFRPQISYMDEKYDDLRYAIKMGTTWDTKLVDAGVNVGPFSSITLLENPNFPFNPRLTPFIVYMAFNYNAPQFALKYARLQNDNVSWSKGTIDPSLGVGLFASVVKDEDDRLHVSYYDGFKGDLRYATSSNGSSWNVRTLQTTGDQGLFSSIAINGADEPGITYFDSTNGTLEFIYKNGANWYSLPTVNAYEIATASNVGLNTSLAISSAGFPHMSYLNETKGWLKHAEWTGLVWGTDVVTNTASLGTFNSIDTIYLNTPKAAYYDVPHGDLLVATRTGSTWVDDIVDQYDDVGSFVSLKIDPFNVPHLSYVNATWDLLNYANWNVATSDWYTTTVDYFDVGGYTSIAVDGLSAFGNVKPGISYFDFVQEEIRYGFMTPFEAWQHTGIADLTDPQGLEAIVEPFSSIDFAVSPIPPNIQNPHIAYYNEIFGDLMYIYFNGTQWVGPNRIDGDGIRTRVNIPGVDVGRYVDLVIDKTSNHSHLCYYDSVAKDLRYAYWDGTNWFYDIVDALGDVGMYCSIDLNSAGVPGISYYDASNADLKFAAGVGFVFPPPLPDQIFIPIVIK
ncbi:MAG: hypothetical protein A2Z16_12575 [Chloroflexi bacterium RBG_16_54_18]|nr:MAG: hypothetical protein A2Z16_12575 [Chloroflexi bacterium RBG_16_54_18]